MRSLQAARIERQGLLLIWPVSKNSPDHSRYCGRSRCGSPRRVTPYVVVFHASHWLLSRILWRLHLDAAHLSGRSFETFLRMLKITSQVSKRQVLLTIQQKCPASVHMYFSIQLILGLLNTCKVHCRSCNSCKHSIQQERHAIPSYSRALTCAALPRS